MSDDVSPPTDVPPVPAGTKIAHVLEAFLPLSETFVWTQLQAQRDLDQIVIARRRESPELSPWPDVTIVDPQAYHPRYGRLVNITRRLPGREHVYRRRIRRVAKRRGVELLFAHFGWSGLHALDATRDLGVPLVTAFYGRDAYAMAADMRAHYAELWDAGAAFTCLGPRAREHLLSIGAPPERTHVVPLGVDIETFAFSPADLDPTAPRFLQIARFMPKKGLDLTLRAFAAVLHAVPGARLEIVGSGPGEDELRRLHGELGLGDAVTFHGALPPERARAVMATCHVGVQPSRVGPDGDREGTPTVIIEYQAYGIEPVATRHADIPAIVAEGTGLVDEEDVDGLAAAMLRAGTRTPEDRRERLAAGRAFVEGRHDIRRVRERLRAIYAEALAGGAR